MYSVNDFEDSEFHDSQLTAMDKDGADVRLVFSNVLMNTTGEDYYRATVVLKGTREISRDDCPLPVVGLEGEGSSVIAFRRLGQTATMLLNWRYYSVRRDELALYQFVFETIEIRAELQDGFLD